MPDGGNAGQADGTRAGFNDCQAQAQNAAGQQGYGDGAPVGQQQGAIAGQADGQRDGGSNGQSEGVADGRRRATADSRAAAQGPATQDGNSQVDEPGVQNQAQIDAYAKANADAQTTANTGDYQRGRTDRHNELVNAPVLNTDSFSQLDPVPVVSPIPPPSTLEFRINKGLLSIEVSVPSPSYRYSNPRPNYRYDSEDSAYRSGYRSGYIDGFNRAYSDSFDATYRPAYANGQQYGCSDAQSRDYTSSYRDGYERGRSAAYSAAYDSAHEAAARDAYNAVYAGASQNAYQSTYASEYERQYAEIRAAAYQSRRNAVYKVAYDAAYRQRYDQVYPVYRDQAYQRGRQDENRNFAGNPMKFVDAALVDVNGDGVIAPGDPVRVKVNLRNYADHAIVATDLEVSITSLSGATAASTKNIPTQGLRAQSMTEIRDLLEIRPTQQAVGTTLTVQVQVKYRGQVLDTKRLTASVKFPIRFAGIELPSGLREGFEAIGKLSLTNLSDREIAAGTKVSLLLPNSIITDVDLLDRELVMPAIPAGGTASASFRFIPRMNAGNLTLPLSIIVKSVEGTVIFGGPAASSAVPISTDYGIDVSSDLAALKKPGMVRVQYELSNLLGQDGPYRSASVRVTVLADDGVTVHPSVRVVGPNPQTLTTLDGSASLKFLVPLLVSSENRGGILVLEVLDDESKVVRSHRENF